MAYSTGYENFYDGSPSSLNPDYGNFIGYRMGANQLGFPGSPQTANQLGEAVNALKQGVKAFEITMLNPDTTDAIPKQHINEIRALMKLSGVKPSVHAPIIDAAGFGEKGWVQGAREDNERRLFNSIERARDLDKSGNLPIVIHSSNGAPGSEFLPGDTEKGEERFKVQKGFAINQETGQLVPLEREYKYRPEHTKSLKEGDGGWGKGKEFTPESNLSSANLTEWKNQLTDLATFTKHADEIMGSSGLDLAGYQDAVIEGNKFYDLKDNKEIPGFSSEKQVVAYDRLRQADIFLEDVELKLNSAFHKAFKYGDDKTREALLEFSQDYSKKYNDAMGIKDIDGKKYGVQQVFGPIKKRKFLGEAINNLNQLTGHSPPKIFREVEDFAKEKASETFGNLAIKSYDKWEDGAPVLAIENLYQGMAFSKADDLRDLVDKSRDRFKKYLIEEKGLSKSEAEETAKKKIGVTWDVGHLNMMKKKGFTDKDVLSETSKIKDYVKHIHLTDNFGFGDSHLAPGMGNVPFKEILMELEKNGEFGKMRKIVEAGGMVQHFKKSPHPWTLSAFGSPIYGAKMSPYWNQVVDVQGNYFGGYGTVNPQQHHSMYSAGFTSMPVELGGQMPGGQSRFDGRPMA